jgi:hypothetical protein
MSRTAPPSKKLPYSLSIGARPDPRVTIEKKHREVLTRLSRIPQPWGLKGRTLRALKVNENEPSAVLNLRGVFGPGTTGSLDYPNRALLLDSAQFDDQLSLGFDARRADYATLVDSGFEALVSALDAYRGEVASHDLTLQEFEAWQGSDIDARHGVFRIQPVNFWHKELCWTAFGLTAIQVAKRLRGHVERVHLACGGVFVIVSREPMTPAEIKPIDARLRKLLRR